MPDLGTDGIETLLADKKKSLGRSMHDLMVTLYPICRSITGNGVRQTLKILRQHIPLHVHEVPSGTPVFDWTVPKEWNIRDAYIKGPDGTKVVDFNESNLHVVSYSVPVRETMSLEKLRPHLHTLPDQPDLIPYRTAYYQKQWGFCLPHRHYEAMPEGDYEVVIDTTLEDGHLSYGELFLPGTCDDEVLISCYTCHPSMCNDNLSGIVLATFLAKHIQDRPGRRYGYRFLFIPETIGALTWLAHNEHQTHRIRHGLVVTCVGDPGCLTYKKSRRGNAFIDRAVTQVLHSGGYPHRIEAFTPLGSDERQYCSPGFNLPVGSILRTPYRQFPEYHTSADNLAFVTPEALGETLQVYCEVIDVLEHDAAYLNTNPKGEPQLGRRGLYRVIGGAATLNTSLEAMMWVLNFSDGVHTLLDIAEHTDLPFAALKKTADMLLAHELLVPAESSTPSRL